MGKVEGERQLFEFGEFDICDEIRLIGHSKRANDGTNRIGRVGR